MDINRIGSQPSTKGSADYFTGAVRIDRLFQPIAPAPRKVLPSRSSPERADRVAHPPAGSDADHHGRLRPGSALGGSDRADSARRRDLVFRG